MPWTTIILALISLASAAFTGGASVTDEQAALLNEAQPGLGTALQIAAPAVNGLAPTYTEWGATYATYEALGLTPGGNGIVQNIGRFLGSVNIYVLLAIAVGIWYLWNKSGQPSVPNPLNVFRRKSRGSNTQQPTNVFVGDDEDLFA